MKLTILRLEHFSAQDQIDLGKIWPEYSASSLSVDETHRIYAARFNERLLGAVRVTLKPERRARWIPYACVKSPVAAASGNTW